MILCCLAYLVLAVLISIPALRTRYLLPALVPLAIPAARGIRESLRRSGPTRIAVACSVAVCLAWSGYRVARLYDRESPFGYASDSQAYLEAHERSYAFFRLSSDYVSAPSDTLLLLDVGNRGFYAPGVPYYGPTDFPFIVLEPLWAGRDAEALLRSLRRRGITHIALDMDMAMENIVPQLDGPQLEQWRRFLARETELVVSSSTSGHALLSLVRSSR